MTLTEPQEMKVLYTVSSEILDQDPDGVIAGARERIQEVASRRGVPDMDTLWVEVKLDGVIDFGSGSIDVREYGLALIEATLMAVPHEGEFDEGI